MSTNSTVQSVTDRIEQRSFSTRSAYMQRVLLAKEKGVARAHLSCSNMAHAYASANPREKSRLVTDSVPNLGIVTAYNDMLSAHQPFKDFPDVIKQTAQDMGATAQVAGGVPAMCDGVTQGQAGMELSLFSRDVIALAAGVAMSHNCFDASVYLGVCDKIIPGLVIAAATFGHIPAVFLPAGPMVSGISNDEKAEARKNFAKGNIDRSELLRSEMKAYHGPGTCTFYGTANSNQMLMEVMGLHLPGASFVNPNTEMREAFTQAGASQALKITALGDSYIPAAEVLSVKTFVNGIIGLHATGGSTNLVLHLIAMADAAGIQITTEDFSDLSKVTPLIAKVYPNGKSDVNHFHAAGGLQYLMSELCDADLLHEDVTTVMGKGLSNYFGEAYLDSSGGLQWKQIKPQSYDSEILATVSKPFQETGGLVSLRGNLGEAVIKISAVPRDRHVIEAPARVFHDQDSVQAAFAKGELSQDFVCVLRFQGPSANGMPELHGLTPILSILQDNGFRVALLTDGRMSGASGKIPAAIHVSPEAALEGPIAKIRDGDVIRIDADKGIVEVTSPEDWQAREPLAIDLIHNEFGTGRELFSHFRRSVGTANRGASVFAGK